MSGFSGAGTAWHNIATAYYDSASRYLSDSVVYKGCTVSGYAHGAILADLDIQAVVFDALDDSAFPADADAVYIVLTSSDVMATSG